MMERGEYIVYYTWPQYNLEGWLCPRCKRVNAPFITECPCNLENKNIEIKPIEWTSKI